MAKRPVLDATSRPKSAFSDWTKNYRQSTNIVDERAKQYRPTDTPKDAEYGTVSNGKIQGRPASASNDTTPDDNSDDIRTMGGGRKTETPTSTRKVSPDEAIRKTHIERR